jgi:hypothetical protein
MLLECRTAAVAAVVLTVRVAGAVGVAEAVTEQTGAGLAVVVMLQVRSTVPVNPPVGLTVIVDVPEVPAATV